MESPKPPGNPSNSTTLFTAAESESVIKYLVSFTSRHCLIQSLSELNEKVGHSIRPYTTGILIPQSASAMVGAVLINFLFNGDELCSVICCWNSDVNECVVSS